MDRQEVPIHKALTTKIMIAGIPREIALLNGTLTAVLVLGAHSLWGIPIGFVIHLVARHMAKHDEQFFEVYRRHMRLKPFYFE